MPNATDRITPDQFQLMFTQIGARSKFYAVPLYVLGSTLTLWAPTVIQALITAWLLWVTCTAVLAAARPLSYLRLLVVLTIATTAPVIVALLMPDVFAACATVAIGLLLTLREALTRPQRAGLVLLLLYSVLVHLTILPIAAGLVVFAAALAWFLVPKIPVWRGTATICAVLACAGGIGAISDMGMRAIFGQDARPPPFLEGRMMADGPGQQFLREVCPERHFVACRWKDMNIYYTDDTIWADVSWHHLPLITDPAERRRFLDEQSAFVLGTVMHHPFAQLWASSKNAVKQLLDFDTSVEIGGALAGILDLHTARTARVLETVSNLGPCLTAAGTQACDYRALFRRVLIPQELVVLGALAVTLVCAVSWLRRPAADQAARHRQRIAAFALIVLAGVILNAVICAVVSGPWGRFHARTVWLIPMMAMLLLENALQGTGWRVLRWRARAAQAVPAETDHGTRFVLTAVDLGARLLRRA
ncbi:MAG: hypothetical protein JO157_05705 [Acetobacteraceae bacterium]|nr:hypothetical protein [Acetobacteraceae bacterium]